MKEKFAGGDYTTTVEAYIAASGRGIQVCCFVCNSQPRTIHQSLNLDLYILGGIWVN